MERISGDLQGRANSVSHVDGVSDLALACWLCGSVAGRAQKRIMSSAFLSEPKLLCSSHLDARHFSSSPFATEAFQAATHVLELRGSESESVCV